MRIAILEGHAVNPGDLSWDVLNQYGELTIYDRTDPADAAARIGDAEIVLINKTPITAELLDACPSVKLICVQATGYNVVDCNAAKERGVLVCNVPNYSTNAVAQFAFSLLLELCNHVGHHNKTVHEGKWSNCADFCYWDTPQMELAGKTLGIVGYGNIGRAVAKIGEAFGMKILACSRTNRPGCVDLDTVLTQSDIITLHCPLTLENTGMINASAIKKMKKGAILINTARGPLLNEAAVADALCSGKLRGAAMDVVSIEPISPDNPLLTAPNCIITPHMAWAPVESRQRIIDCTCRSIEGYLSKKPVNVVNL